MTRWFRLYVPTPIVLAAITAALVYALIKL